MKAALLDPLAIVNGLAGLNVTVPVDELARVTVLDASLAGLPLVAPMVAVEVWLDPDGSVRIVPPHEIARPVDSPIPNCQSASS